MVPDVELLIDIPDIVEVGELDSAMLMPIVAVEDIDIDMDIVLLLMSIVTADSLTRGGRILINDRNAKMLNIRASRAYIIKMSVGRYSIPDKLLNC